MLHVHSFQFGDVVAVLKPGDSCEINQPVQQSPESVIMRPAMQTRPMIHRIGNNSAARSDNQSRQEPVHVIEVRHGEKCAALEDFDAAAAVRRVIVKNPATHSVRERRTEPPPSGVSPLMSEAGDHAALIAEP